MFEYTNNIQGLYEFFIIFLAKRYEDDASVCPYWIHWDVKRRYVIFKRDAKFTVKVDTATVWKWMDTIEERYMIFPMRIVSQNSDEALMILCDRSSKVFILIDPMNGKSVLTDYTDIVNVGFKEHPPFADYEYVSLQTIMLECQAFLEVSRKRNAPHSTTAYGVPLSIYMAHAIIEEWPKYEDRFICLPHFIKRYICDPYATMHKVERENQVIIAAHTHEETKLITRENQAEVIREIMQRDFKKDCLESDKPWKQLMGFCNHVMVSFRDTFCTEFYQRPTFSTIQGTFHGWLVSPPTDEWDMETQYLRIKYAYHWTIAAGYLLSINMPVDWDSVADRVGANV